ncbi:RNA polymerase sigma factor [Pseudonocardia alaniniphila]|uniref:Sigma-70 family RNA polymerase sigma factor n=1 Tax=Pseudonocardia alaniniphila TaxID=75291 RepID=A0ABS9TCV0_9PSEU|nr:sigma-70 family RNA polymerase sigma factor [Pseudonocardia alaniniphila]MCH6166362.1 sigma-70 family RNA polymerase sigma factor [Pseudonocardia alaniniphila]
MADVADNPDASDQRARDGAAVSGMRGHDRSDEEFAQAVMTGVEPAFAALYDRYCRRAYSLARRICVNEGLAETVVQEVFLAFWREPRRFDSGCGSFGSWILTLVHHRSVDAVRREATVRHRNESVGDHGRQRVDVPAPAAGHGASRAVRPGRIRNALRALPADQRRALALTYYGGYTQREVAAMTRVPLGTVQARMSSGVQYLRHVLGPVQGDASAGIRGGGAR